MDSDKNKMLLFYSGEVNLLGMRSSVNPASLPNGIWYNLQNIRASRFNVSARYGCDRLSAQPVASASFRGCWSGYLFGLFTMLAAFRVSSATRIYRFTGSGWSELTGASTRFSTDGFVDFAPFTEPGLSILGSPFLAAQDCVLIGNGTDQCGIAYYDSGAVNYAYTVVTTPTPNESQLFASQPTPPGWFNIRDKDNTTYVNSGAQFVMADSGTSDTENEIDLTFNAAAAVGDTSYVEFGTSSTYEGSGTRMRLDEAKQFHILCEDTIDDPIWNYLALAIGDANATSAGDADWKTIYDPTSSVVPKPIYTEAAEGVYLATFDLTPYNTLLTSLVALEKFKLTVSKKIAANRTGVRIIAFMSGGLVDSSAETVVSYMLKESRVESARRVCTIYPGPLVSNVGGSDARQIYIPTGEGLYFKNYVYYQNPSSTTAANLACFYRKDPIDNDYYIAGVATLSSNSTATQTKIDNARVDQKGYGRKAPSDFTIPPPKGRCMASGNDRLFIGAPSGERSRVYISDQKFPMRFSSIPRDSDGDSLIDFDSGTSVAFPGEDVQRLIPLPGTIVGAAPMAVMTNQNTWRIEGRDAYSLSRATLLSPRGTQYPRTVTIYKGNLFWLDSERQPTMLTSGLDTVSLGIDKIEDQFEVNDPTNAFGIVWKERYYTSIRQTGETVNQLVVIWDGRLNEYITDVYVNPDWAGFMVQEQGGSSGRRLIGITETGEAFELEKPGQLVDEQKTGSSTDAITILMETGNLRKTLWTEAVFGCPCILCDVMTGVTLTFTWIDTLRSTPTSTNQTSTVDVGTVNTTRTDSNTDNGMWRLASSAKTGTDPGISSHAARLRLTGSATPGKFITGIGIDFSENTTRGPERA